MSARLSLMPLPTRDNEIEALFAPVGVRAFSAEADPELVEQLRDEERRSIGPMSPARQAEFATARACARAAMGSFGVDAALPRRDSGAPAWPQGMAGSISHTRGFCVAVAGVDGTALGIDVELVDRMSSAVERRVLGDDERRVLADLDGETRSLQVATIFAAKEAFYKAHYEVDPRYLGFDAVVVTVGDQDVRYAPGSGVVSGALLERCRGRVRFDRGRVIVGVVIDAAGWDRPLPSPA